MVALGKVLLANCTFDRGSLATCVRCQPMAMLAQTIAPVTRRTVVDRTGLTSSYAVTLTF